MPIFIDFNFYDWWILKADNVGRPLAKSLSSVTLKKEEAANSF